MVFLASLIAAVSLAAVQLLPRFVPTFEGSRRSGVLSAAGGFSTAFVFLELLPQVRERAEAVTDQTEGFLGFVYDEAYFLALTGLLTFYGLERLARLSRGWGHDPTDDPVGLVQISAFAGYYLLIGYLLWSQAAGGGSELIGFSLAVGVHFLVVDYGLRAHHPVAYRLVGRWVLTAAVLVGWLAGWLVAVPEYAVGIGLAFLAGGVMLITMKEELPEEAEGRFLPFLGGVGTYTALVALL